MQKRLIHFEKKTWTIKNGIKHNDNHGNTQFIKSFISVLAVISLKLIFLICLTFQLSTYMLSDQQGATYHLQHSFICQKD